MDTLAIMKKSLLAGSLAGLAVDLSLYPIDTIKTRLQGKQVLKSASLFSSLYSGVSSVLIGSGPSSALFFTTYCLIKEKWKFSSEWKTHLVAAASGEVTACLIRVPVEVVKQRAQVHQNQSLMRIVQQTFAHEGFLGLYRGYFATVTREIPFSIIQFPLWEFFKKYWSEKQQSPLAPWQGALCGSLAGGIAASLTTPLDVAKTRIMLAHHSDTDATSNSLKVLRQIHREEGIQGVYRGIIPRTLWISLGGLIYFGAFEVACSMFFSSTTIS